MKSILLIGLGRYGRHVAMELHTLKHQVMAIDRNEDLVNDILPYVTNALIGDCSNPNFLATLDIQFFDVCIVAIGDNFQQSLEITSLLKEMGAKHVISRAATDIQEKFLLRNGADQVVYPEKQLARWTAVRCTSEHILDFIDLDGDFDIYEMQIPKSWNGKTVLQMDLRKKYDINILAIRENGVFNMRVGPETVFHSGDSILILSQLSSLQKCFHI
ncbi:MAG: TrkA family potassium uptake protein [Oscillospiraceae bacterium]|nr:TrkA family potassium uptake protein [Oscillospiraceae bacterium]